MNNELLFHKMNFIHEAFEKRNKRSSETSLSRGQGRILAMLQRKDGFSTKELSHILNIRVTSLNETLNKLEKNNYIMKVPSESDRRVLIIKLTDKGREFKPPVPGDIDIFDCLDEGEKENLNNYLERIMFEFNVKFKNEHPEEYDAMVKHRKEILNKYFNQSAEDERWFNLIKK